MRATCIKFIHIVVFAIVAGCHADEHDPNSSPLFELVDGSLSGVDFSNDLSANARQNIFNYMYFYNGAGVGVGDFDGDGLQDLYFAGNQVADRVYLNLGDFAFKDVTEASGVLQDSAWSTGVSIADVNGDHKPDVFVSVVSPMSATSPTSRLYLNTSAAGQISFVEAADSLGLAVQGYGTQALWLDYDQDGDLDVYILRHSVHQEGTFGPRARASRSDAALSGDLFFENREGRFYDISKDVGILQSGIGYGLGITSADFNQDGFPDIYVANDFHEDDYLYLNQHGSGFRDVLRNSMPHTARFSMGVDAADLNNDRIPDVVTLDMLPDDPAIVKGAMAEDPYDIWHLKLKQGYWPQFSRNTLQLSQGLVQLDSATQVPLYADGAIYAGLHASDWSWSVLLNDFNLDGLRDVFISNGILGRSNDLDYIKFVSSESNQRRLRKAEVDSADLRLADRMPVVPLANRIYFAEDTTGLHYAKYSVGRVGFSHGAVAVDLDNDGDLDLVTSDVNGAAQLLRNQTIAPRNTAVDWVGLELQIDGLNSQAFGAVVSLSYSDSLGAPHIQQAQVQPIRGFQSSSDSRLTFGLPTGSRAISAEVRWPSGQVSNFTTELQLNHYNTISPKLATARDDFYKANNYAYEVRPASEVGLDVKHIENNFVEFNRQALIPHMTSREGPCVAVADFNGDGLDDAWFGAAKTYPSALFFQSPSGQFTRSVQPIFEAHRQYEDTDVLAQDVDADGDMDLIVLSGGAEYPTTDTMHRPRLYLNDGQGDFSYHSGAFPQDVALVGQRILLLPSPSASDPSSVNSTVATQLRLVLLPRSRTDAYGLPADGYVLAWDGSRFVDETVAQAPWLRNYGMVTDATLLTADNQYLVIARDWQNVEAYAIAEGSISAEAIQVAPAGLWQGLAVVYDDVQQASGYLVCGNLGLNSKFAARGDSVLGMYVADFDNNGSSESVVTITHGGEEDVFASRDELTKQLVHLRKSFTDYATFAASSLDAVLSDAELSRATTYRVESTASVYVPFGKTGFGAPRQLPAPAQLSTTHEGVMLDSTMFLFGNRFDVNIQRGKYDASYGYGLRLDHNDLRLIAPSESGVFVSGEVRDAAPIDIAGQQYVLVVRNDDAPVLISRQAQPFN